MKKYFITTLLSLTLIAVYAPAAHATSLAVTVDITAGCRGTVNGNSSITLPVDSTQSSNITIFNQNGFSYQNVTGPGFSGALAYNNKVPTGEVTRTFNVGTITSNTTITVTPVITQNTDPYITANNSCPPGSNPVPSTIILTPIKPTSTPSSTTPKSTTPSNTKTTTPSNTTTAPAESTVQKEDAAETQDISQPTKKKDSVMPIYVWAFVGLTAAVIALMIQKKKKNTKKTKSVKRTKKSKSKK